MARFAGFNQYAFSCECTHLWNMGRKTEGHLYANIALAIVLSFILTSLVGGIIFFVHVAILQLPT